MEERHLLAAIVLAAGRSARMGAKNKLLLPWGEKTILQATVETVLSVPFAEVIAVVGHQRQSVGQLLRNYPLRLVDNPAYAQGLSTSLVHGVAAASPHLEGYLFALGDMPAVARETLVQLCRAFPRGDAATIAVPTSGGRRGNPVLFGRAHRRALLHLEGDVGARAIVRQNPARVIEVPVEDPGIFADVDTPQAYQKLSRP